MKPAEVVVAPLPGASPSPGREAGISFFTSYASGMFLCAMPPPLPTPCPPPAILLRWPPCGGEPNWFLPFFAPRRPPDELEVGGIRCAAGKKGRS